MSGVPPPPSPAQMRANRDQAIIANQIARGVGDENKVTDAVFYDRHPERGGRPLRSAERPLKQEWTEIRDKVVRPALRNRQNKPSRQPSSADLPQSRQRPGEPPRFSPQAPQAQEPDWLHLSSFENIRRFRPDQYRAAYAAQEAYRKISGFFPFYNKILSTLGSVNISQSRRGVGNLVFSIEGRALMNLLENKATKDRVIEAAASGIGDVIFDPEEHPGSLGGRLIEIMGLGLTLLEIAQGLENERMLNSKGPEAERWITEKKLQFVCLIMAEELSKTNWADNYFASRNTRDVAHELVERFKEFSDTWHQWTRFVDLDYNLGKYQGNIPDELPRQPQTYRLPPAPDPELESDHAEPSLGTVSVGQSSPPRRGRWIRRGAHIFLLDA